MKYYSDITKDLYESAEACAEAEAAELKARKEAEEAAVKKSKERKTRADEIDNAFKALKEAQQHYYDLVSEFVKDYGYYHKSYTLDEIGDLFTHFFDL